MSSKDMNTKSNEECVDSNDVDNGLQTDKSMNSKEDIKAKKNQKDQQPPEQTNANNSKDVDAIENQEDCDFSDGCNDDLPDEIDFLRDWHNPKHRSVSLAELDAKGVIRPSNPAEEENEEKAITRSVNGVIEKQPPLAPRSSITESIPGSYRVSGSSISDASSDEDEEVQDIRSTNETISSEIESIEEEESHCVVNAFLVDEEQVNSSPPPPPIVKATAVKDTKYSRLCIYGSIVLLLFVGTIAAVVVPITFNISKNDNEDQSSSTGYCTTESSPCNGEAPSGDFCNKNENNCKTECGGKWCIGEPNVPVAANDDKNETVGYCNWGLDGEAESSTCNGEAQGGTYCNVNGKNCQVDCGGKWCEGPTTEASVSGTATSTRYWDCSGGACGCAYLPFGDPGQPAYCHSNALFAAPPENEYGAVFYGTAAVSESLGGDYWLGEACGKCWRVTSISNVVGRPKTTTTIILKATNYCPPENCGSAPHFDIAAPGFDSGAGNDWHACEERDSAEMNGYKSCAEWMIASHNADENCDCGLFVDPVLREGCENFLSLGWDNPVVNYEAVSCPRELSDLPCWEENGNNYPEGIPDLCADSSRPTESNVFNP